MQWKGKRYDKSGNIIYELNNSNENAKEYNCEGILIFEGEYLNGRKNGKGKEYNYDGNLVFEGEYLNDKKNGKGKEFNDISHLIFEGEYLNGIQWIGNIYDEDGNIILEINNGSDKGKEYYFNCNLKYDGEY